MSFKEGYKMHTRLMLAFPVFALLALFAFILEAQETEAGIHPDVAGLKAAKFTQDKQFEWIPPQVTPPVPHFDIIGSDAPKAQAVFEALNAILNYEQLPTIDVDQEYEISTLYCSWSPPGLYWRGSTDNKCNLQYRIGRDDKFTELNMKDIDGVNLAENLYKALFAAGARDPKGSPVWRGPVRYNFNIELRNVRGSLSELHFDNYTYYSLSTPPNVTAQGDLVQQFLKIFDSIKIDDEDVLSLLICSTVDTELPECSYQFYQQIYPKPLIPLNAELALKLWNSIKAMAKASGFEASTGVSLDEMNLLNASDFSYDNGTLGMHLFIDFFAVPPTIPSPPLNEVEFSINH
jgi:hypothetical protein